MDNKETQSIAASAGKVSGATAFSRVMGLIREQVMAYFFGAGMATDAFVAAFRIPNLLRDLFAEGALSSAFVPVFKDKMVTSGNKEAFRLANLTISSLLLVVGLVIALGIIFTPAIIYISANGFTSDPGKFNLTVILTRLMFVYLLLVSVSAAFMGILNSFGRFGVPAMSPALFNLGMILAPIFLYSYFSVPIYTLAIGVIVGGIGQLVFQIPSLLRIGFKFRFLIDFADEGVRRMGRLISPMILGLSASRINILVNTLLASLLIEGAISYLNYAYRLMHFPLGVFGVALGTVTLPKVSDDVARKDSRQLVRTFHEAIGLAFFLIIPSAVYLAGFGEELIRLIYQRGAFGPEATVQTTRALYLYSFGLVGFAGVRIVAPVYYALSDAKRPMYYSVTAVAINIALNFAFIPVWGFAGLAAATSVAGLSNLLLLVINLKGKVVGVDYSHIIDKVFKVLLCSLAAMLAVKLIGLEALIAPVNLMGKIAIVGLQIAIMGIIYILLARLLKVNEVTKLMELLGRRQRNR
ncbi:MAG: murein biosynthesis integral membrane protein MurJ [Candidatus Zixiibacteriota bacterium]|nr:MAG: murein biosynthesis integral membrane protein MurJ [candidate division Zixibacteria bacterium]